MATSKLLLLSSVLAVALAACAAIKCYDGAVSSVSNSLATKKDCAAGIDVCKYWGTGIALTMSLKVESRSLTRPLSTYRFAGRPGLLRGRGRHLQVRHLRGRDGGQRVHAHQGVLLQHRPLQRQRRRRH